MSTLFFILLLFSVKHYSYKEIVSEYQRQLDEYFRKESSLEEIFYPVRPSVNFKMYLPLERYVKDITYFPGFSYPIYTENKTTKYGFELKINKFVPFFDIYVNIEGDKSSFDSNIYSPSHQKNMYIETGIRREFLKPDKYSILWKLSSTKPVKIYIKNLQKEKNMLFNFKKEVLEYLNYREKLDKEKRILNYIFVMDTIITSGWKNKALSIDKYLDFKLMHLGLIERAKEDSFNLKLKYKRIKLLLDVPDSFVINGDSSFVINDFDTMRIDLHRRDIQFLADSISAIEEFYNGLMNCVDIMPGASFSLNVGAKEVVLENESSNKLFPSNVNLGIELSFSSFRAIKCRGLLKDKLKRELQQARIELFLRNEKRIALLEKYRMQKSHYIELLRELKEILVLMEKNNTLSDFETLRSYINMYSEVLDKIYSIQIEIERIRSEFP